MAVQRLQLRLPWVALVAIMGMLSVAGEATAGTVNGASRECCIVRTCDKCCCDAPSTSSPPATTNRPSAHPSDRANLTTPTRPCECRSGEPAAPAPKPASRSSESRGDQARSNSFARSVDAPAPADVFARLLLPTGSPPKTPLYLRTARLLI
jgi:hypothetical protein